VEAFIAGKPASAATSGGKILARQDGRQLVRKTIYLEPDLDQRLRMRAAAERRKESEMMAEALEEWLARRGG